MNTLTPRIAVGRAIRGLMVERGITQTALAESAAMARTTVVKKLRGEIALTVDDLDRFAIALDVPASLILDRAEQIRAQAATA